MTMYSEETATTEWPEDTYVLGDLVILPIAKADGLERLERLIDAYYREQARIAKTHMPHWLKGDLNDWLSTQEFLGERED